MLKIDPIQNKTGFLIVLIVEDDRTFLRKDVETLSAATHELGLNLLLSHSEGNARVLIRNEFEQKRPVIGVFYVIRPENQKQSLKFVQVMHSAYPDIFFVLLTSDSTWSVDGIDKILGSALRVQWDFLPIPSRGDFLAQKVRQIAAIWNQKCQSDQKTDRLVRSERLAAVGQVSRGIGHEFGNLLLRIIGKTDLALLERDVAKIHDHLGVAMAAAEKAGMLVRNLQSFSRNTPVFQLGSVVQTLDEALLLLRHEFLKYSVTIEKKYVSVSPLRFDAASLSQVFLNLLLNAIQAMVKGGVLTITVRPALRTVSGVEVIIADTGVGIAPESLARVFDFAFTTKGDRGSGLGLSISREIVEAHGGQVSIATEVGKGTQLTVWLPGSAGSEDK
ncbi:ATP-binding protein [Bdellovibrionota bacterium FG-1]